MKPHCEALFVIGCVGNGTSATLGLLNGLGPKELSHGGAYPTNENPGVHFKEPAGELAP